MSLELNLIVPANLCHFSSLACSRGTCRSLCHRGISVDEGERAEEEPSARSGGTVSIIVLASLPGAARGRLVSDCGRWFFCMLHMLVYNCQKKPIPISNLGLEAVSWKQILVLKVEKKNLVFLKRHEYEQYFSAYFLAFSSRLALGLGIISFFSLLKFAPVETSEGGKRTLLEFQRMNLNGLLLKRDCTVLLRLLKNWKAPLSLQTIFFFIVGVKDNEVVPFSGRKEVVMQSDF